MTSPQADKLDRFLASQQSTRAATATTINTTINVQASEGMSNDDARRVGTKAAEGFIDSRAMKVIMREQRPGGVLHKR